ncbi:MAG: hypothetical protein GY810_21500 [Aureispira sp.]|nr:hypothetical protein [Aureispira sp.]
MLHLKFKFVVGVFFALCLYSCTSDNPSSPSEVGNNRMENDSIQLSLEQKIEDSIAAEKSLQEIIAKVNIPNNKKKELDTFSYSYGQMFVLLAEDMGKGRIAREEFFQGFLKGINPRTNGLDVLDATMTVEINRALENGAEIPNALKQYNNGKKFSYNMGMDSGAKLLQIGYPLEEIHIPSLWKSLGDKLEASDSTAIKQGIIKLNQVLGGLKAYRVATHQMAQNRFLRKNLENPNIKATETKLQYEILKEGTGPKPTSNAKLTAHFEGKNIDGRIFDSSIKRGQPIEFKLDDMIEGWKEALPMMKEGAKWRLYLPPVLGYDSVSYGILPPASVLIYDIELLKVEG